MAKKGFASRVRMTWTTFCQKYVYDDIATGEIWQLFCIQPKDTCCLKKHFCTLSEGTMDHWQSYVFESMNDLYHRPLILNDVMICNIFSYIFSAFDPAIRWFLFTVSSRGSPVSWRSWWCRKPTPSTAWPLTLRCSKQQPLLLDLEF